MGYPPPTAELQTVTITVVHDIFPIATGASTGRIPFHVLLHTRTGNCLPRRGRVLQSTEYSRILAALWPMEAENIKKGSTLISW